MGDCVVAHWDRAERKVLSVRFIPLAFAISLGLAAPLTIEDVRNMAFDKGIVKIEEVELHKGIWKVEGDDASGHEIEMKIDAWSGEIVKLKWDD
jgi:uncharacterized membrane protein YkoI